LLGYGTAQLLFLPSRCHDAPDCPVLLFVSAAVSNFRGGVEREGGEGLA